VRQTVALTPGVGRLQPSPANLGASDTGRRLAMWVLAANFKSSRMHRSHSRTGPTERPAFRPSGRL